MSSPCHKTKLTKSRLVAYGVAFLVVGSIPDLSFAHRRYGSCGHSYGHSYNRHPRRYDYNWGSRWGGCGGYRSCGSSRRYGDAIDIFGDLVYAGMNTLTRQQRRNIMVADRQQSRYSIEDYGRNGLELTLEVPDLTAQEINLEIIRESGVNTLVVSGSPGFSRQRSSATSYGFSQSFIIRDDDIDVDGVTARVSSAILTISLPRKTRTYRKRMGYSDTKDGRQQNGDEILVFNSKRRSNHGENERLARQPVIVRENPGNTFDESNSIKRKISLEEVDGLYISEEEDIY